MVSYGQGQALPIFACPGFMVLTLVLPKASAAGRPRMRGGLPRLITLTSLRKATGLGCRPPFATRILSLAWTKKRYRGRYRFAYRFGAFSYRSPYRYEYRFGVHFHDLIRT